jgi:hypothetical protein
MLFLRGSPRPAARAVKAAVCVFIGAKRRALTEEAGGWAQHFRRKGKEDKANLKKHPPDGIAESAFLVWISV